MKKIKTIGFLVLVFFAIVNGVYAEASSQENNCAAIALWQSARMEGINSPLEHVKAKIQHTDKAISLGDLKQVAEQLGLTTKIVIPKWEDIIKLTSPAIVRLNDNNFVVIERPIGTRYVLVVDCTGAHRLYTREESEDMLQGELLIVSNPKLQEEKAKSQVKEPPKIVFDEPRYDFGEVEEGTVVTHSFKFRNDGGSPLKITNVRKGCGCTSAVAGKEELQPGEESEIKVTFNSKGRRGRQTQRIQVYSNDPENPRVELIITGLVKQEFYVTPSRLYVGRVARGKPVTREIYIMEPGDTNIEITKTETSTPDIKVEVVPFEKETNVPEASSVQIYPQEQKRYVLKVNVLTNREPGQFLEKIILTTNSKKKPVVEIPVIGTVVGEFGFLPPKAYFGYVRPGQKAIREINLISHTDKEFSIGGINVNDLPVNVRLKTGSEKAKRHTLVLELQPSEKPQTINGYIDVTVQVDDKEQTLRLPVLVIIRE